MFKFVAWQVLQNYVSNMTQSNARFLCDTECLAKPPPQKRGYLRDGDILLLVCSSVRLFVCRLKRVLLLALVPLLVRVSQMFPSS